MAKSVSVLFTVIAVAISLHTVHRVSAAFPIPEAFVQRIESLLPKANSFIESKVPLMIELKEKAEKLKDSLELLINKYVDNKEDRPFSFMAVTEIEVNRKPLLKSEGGLVLIKTTPIPFLLLSKEAFGLLKNEFPESKLIAKFHQLCTTAQAPAVTLVFTTKDANKEELPFYTRRSDGSKCLAMLLSSPSA